jgi:hypothetical protein
MNARGRPKREFRSAQHEETPVSPHGHSKGASAVRSTEVSQ